MAESPRHARGRSATSPRSNTRTALPFPAPHHPAMPRTAPPRDGLTPPQPPARLASLCSLRCSSTVRASS